MIINIFQLWFSSSFYLRGVSPWVHHKVAHFMPLSATECPATVLSFHSYALSGHSFIILLWREIALPQPYETPSTPKRCFLTLLPSSTSNAPAHYSTYAVHFWESALKVRIDFLELESEDNMSICLKNSGRMKSANKEITASERMFTTHSPTEEGAPCPAGKHQSQSKGRGSKRKMWARALLWFLWEETDELG